METLEDCLAGVYGADAIPSPTTVVKEQQAKLQR